MKRFALIATLALASTSLFAADTYTVDKTHSEVKFSVRHLISRVSGKFSDFSGTITVDPATATASSVEFHIKSASIDTSTPDRDKHLRSGDFFDVEKFPELTFKSVSIRQTAKKDSYDVTGDLTMHGVTKRVTLPVEVTGYAKDPWGNDRVGFTLSTTLNRKDYGINWNKALDNGGALLGDDVDVTVNLEAVKAKPAAK